MEFPLIQTGLGLLLLHHLTSSRPSLRVNEKIGEEQVIVRQMSWVENLVLWLCGNAFRCEESSSAAVLQQGRLLCSLPQVMFSTLSHSPRERAMGTEAAVTSRVTLVALLGWQEALWRKSEWFLHEERGRVLCEWDFNKQEALESFRGHVPQAHGHPWRSWKGSEWCWQVLLALVPAQVGTYRSQEWQIYSENKGTKDFIRNHTWKRFLVTWS